MSRLEWGKSGERIFETGFDRGVIYPPTGPGVSWIGLIGFEEEFGEDSSEPVYFDGVKVRDVESIGDFGGTLSAFTYPDIFDTLRGVQDLIPGVRAEDQGLRQFDLTYRTLIGNDLEGEDFGYRVHLVYNAMVVPSARARETNTNEVSLTAFEWQIVSVPEDIPGYRPTAHLILDSTRISDTLMALLERVLYGDSDTDPRMLTIDEFLQLGFTGPFTVVDNGDGTVTISSDFEGAINYVTEDQVEIYDLNTVPIDDDFDDSYIIYTTS